MPNDTPTPKLQAMAQQFIDALPYAQALGMSPGEVGEGYATISMPYDERLVGDPETGVIHGGAMSALMDTCAGTAVAAHPKASISTSTLNLRIDYMRPATPGDRIVARADCYHVTRTVAFVRVESFDSDETRPVALGTGAFTV